MKRLSHNIIINIGLIIILSSTFSFSQSIPKEYNKDSIISLMDSATILKMQQKLVPEEFYPAFWVIFTTMPEVEHLNFKVEKRKIGFTMTAIPAYTWHISKKNRRYKININNYKEKIGNVMLKQIPFNAQVGIISHEVGHLVYYSERSFINLIGHGIGYICSKRFKRKFEAAADIIAIEHGFGYQLVDFNDFIMHKSQAKPWYLRKKKKIYLQEDELLKIIKEKGF